MSQEQQERQNQEELDDVETKTNRMCQTHREYTDSEGCQIVSSEGISIPYQDQSAFVIDANVRFK